MKKYILIVLLSCLLAGSLFASGSSEKSTDESDGPSGTITFSIWDNNLNNFIEDSDMIGRFQKVYPNVDVEVEKLKDDTEYFKAMKMRASANQLPDIMYNKVFTMDRFKENMLPLNDTEANKNNFLSEGYAKEGVIYGIPQQCGYTYVYYWKDLLKEANVEIPTTWPEFVEACKTLQTYYEKDDPDFMALACGFKDEWPDYPYMEFMPAMTSGNGDVWNDAAKIDAPFAKGTGLNDTYKNIYDLFNSGVLGKDPLGLGNDQVTSLFAIKKASFISFGDWGLQNIKNGVTDPSILDDLGTFYLPTRQTVDEPYYINVQGDSFMGITKSSKHLDASMAFLEWFFSDDNYPAYINAVTSSSSMTSAPKAKDPILAESDNNGPEKEIVMYMGENEDFINIQNYTTFNYKKLGAQMLMQDFDFDETMNELNTKWAEARVKLDLN